jgi:prevent-host-death family protein
MTRHVPYNEVSENLAKFMEEARTVPVYIDRGVNTAVLMSKEQFESLTEMARHPRGSEGLLATLETLAPLNDRLPPIPDPAPNPFEL